MKIALVSLCQVWENKRENFSLCQNYIEKAVDENVDLVVFPEMTLTGFSTNIDIIAEDEKQSETIKNFKLLAKENNIAILFGIVIADGVKALNKSIFIDKNSTIISIYSKIHPFSFSGENRYFNAGNKLSIVYYEGFKIGLTICYDLRFPELYAALSKESDLIINIANWPEKRIDHWDTLLKSRAIENQIFIAGVNRVGLDGNNLKYKESSCIYNANGETLKYDIIEDMKIYIIDKNWTIKFKEKFDTISDRKVNFYREII